MDKTIRFRLYQPGDREALLDLFRAVYGESVGAKTSAWRYLDRPPGCAIISVAEADGRIVGAQPSHNSIVQVQGAPIPGALLLDVMTHPGYRRRGVFAGVVETLRRALLEQGTRLLLTTPNEDAARGFRRLPAWKCLGEMSPLVLPVDILQLIVGRSPRNRLPARASAGIERCTSLDRPIGDLCREFSALAPCMVTRSEDSVRWRFSRGPASDYTFHLGVHAGQCDGMAVTKPGRLIGRDVLLLAEILLAGPDASRATDLLQAVREEAREARAAAVVSYLSPRSPLLPVLTAHGFWRVPRSLRPRSYTVWIAGDLEPPVLKVAGDFATWHMSLADSDLG